MISRAWASTLPSADGRVMVSFVFGVRSVGEAGARKQRVVGDTSSNSSPLRRVDGISELVGNPLTPLDFTAR